MTPDTKDYPKCIRCGEIIRYNTGEVVSFRAYVGLNGTCNGCLNKQRQTPNERTVDNGKS